MAALVGWLGLVLTVQAQQVVPLWEAPAGMRQSAQVQAWHAQHQAWWIRVGALDDCPKVDPPVLDPSRATYAFEVQPGQGLRMPVVYLQDYLAQDVWVSGTDAQGCPFLKHVGRHVPVDRRDILSPYPNVVLPAWPTLSPTLVLVQDSKGKTPTLGVMEAPAFTRQSVGVLLGIGAIASTLMTVLIISAVFFLRQRLIDIRSNLVFTACLWVWMLQTYSIGEIFVPLWPSGDAFGLMQGLAAGGVIVSAGWCVARFSAMGPRFRRLYLAGVVFNGALFFIAHMVDFLYPWARIALLLSTSVTVWVVLKMMRRREPVKLFYGLGFMSLVVGGVLQTAAQTMFSDTIGLRADVGLPIGASLLTVWWLIATVYLVRQKRDQDFETLLTFASTDHLTGLWSRDHVTALTTQRLQLDRMHRACIHLLMLDLDHFKRINDTQGHEVGDDMLVEVAHRIQGIAQAQWGEQVFIGRFGGDAFVIMVECEATLADQHAWAQAIIRAISQPMVLRGRDLRVGVSLGWVSDDGSYDSADALLRDADIAMYEAKKRGRAQAVVFEPHMQKWVQARFDLEVALARAIENKAFELHFQPIVHLQTGAHAGMEALVRWHCPQRGMVSPADFIPLAEENGMIVPIGRQVLELAMQALAQWKQQGLWREGWYVSVNVSGRQLSDASLFEDMMALLARYQLSPQDLRLELTESAVIANLNDANTLLPRIEQQGVALCMDDFGTGYSSLSYLSRLPFHVLKIDRSFMEDIAISEARQALIRSVLTLARDMKLQVVAEGVECLAQRDWLSRMACGYGQGYLFSKPLSAPHARDWLAQALEAVRHAPARQTWPAGGGLLNARRLAWGRTAARWRRS